MTIRYSTMALMALLMTVSNLPDCSGQESPTRYFLIGNSLTWDTVPTLLDGDTQWHVDCGKSLPYIVEHPEEPCVKSSTLWPNALKEQQYDVICLQVHYGSTLREDVDAVSQLIGNQPRARIVIHTGWARSAERVAEWTQTAIDAAPSAQPMSHNPGYLDKLLRTLHAEHPDRVISRTRAMDMLQQVERDIASGNVPVSSVAELYRDKIHMDVVTGRYLMHNAMRNALGQPRSSAGFRKLEPDMKAYLDSVLDRVLR